jgi:hypothetical protein
VKAAATLATAIALLSPHASAEEFTCTYRWSGETDNFPLFIDVSGGTAVTKGGPINQIWSVVEDTTKQLILVQPSTGALSGKPYPAGASLIVIDRATNKMVRSNTFIDESYNHHAIGSCSPLLK